MAAGDSSGGDFEVGTWKLILFFLLILVLDTTWEFIDERVTHGIRRRKKKGLMHAWEQIKFEIMALGLVSLLLVVFEKYLLKICVDKKKDTDDSYASEDDTYDSSRRLLAAAAGDSCPDGKEPLWSSALIHKVHILIFLIAVSHVVYALMSLGISMLSMRRFHAFEKVAQQGDLLALPTDQLQRDGESRIMFGIRQAVRQFTHPIDKATYIALRQLFIEAVQVDPSFDFSNFVSDYLAEEFSHVVRLEFLMWVVAIVWIAFPSEAYAGIWLTALFCSLSVIAGAKLHVIAMHLARQAYSLYYLPEGDCGDGGKSTTSEDPSSGEDPSGTHKWLGATPAESHPVLTAPNGESIETAQNTPQQSLRMKSVGLSTLSKDEVKSPGSGGVRTSGSDDAKDMRTPGAQSADTSPSKGHPTSQSSNDVLKEVPEASEAASESVAPSRHFFTAPVDGPEAVATSASDMLPAGIPEESKESSPLSSGAGKAPPKPGAVVEGATDEADTEGDSIGLPLPHSIPECSNDIRSAATKQGEKSKPAVPALEIEQKGPKTSARNSKDRKAGENSNSGSPRKTTLSRISARLSPRRAGSPNATRALHQTPRSPQQADKVSDASSDTSSEASEAFCAPCMRCGRTEKAKSKVKSPRRVKKWEQQQEYKALFWFKRPRLMLRIFQYAYFENALSLAVLVFAFWQNESSMIGGGIGASDPDKVSTGSIVAGVLLLVLDLCLLVHSSYFVLPVHALTAAAVNFGSQLKVLQAAKQYRVRPDILHELEDTGDDEEDMYHENDYLPEEYHRHHRQSPLYATSATTNTPHETTSHFQTPMSAQGSGALGDGNGGTQISPEGPVQVFSSTRNSAATGLSSPESDGNLGVSQPAPRVYVRSNSNPDLQQPGTTGSAPAARPRPALARRSAAPALMQGPQPLEASPGLTVGVTNGPAAAPVRRHANLARASCPVVSDFSAAQKPGVNSGFFPNLRTALKKETRLATPRPNLQRNSATSAIALDVRSPAGATRLGSGELPGQHHDPEEAPAVLEALMQSMVQYRRRLDQQGASQGSLPTARSYGAVQGGAPRPRSALSRHSDVSAVLSRAASNTGPSGGVADNGAAGESTATPSPGEAHPGGRPTGPRVFTRVLTQGGTTGGFIRKSTSAEQLTTNEAPE